MSEPPILPNSNDPASENPFAPTYIGTVGRGVSTIHLDVSYWIAFGVLLISSVMLSLAGLPIAWMGVFASIMAAIRVPLLQRKHSRDVSGFETSGAYLPSPLALLFTSFALMTVFVFVSLIAFVAVCLPGTIAFGLGDMSNTVAMVSGLIGVLCFFSMYFLSLRLRF